MERGKILESWKEIASHLKRNVRTCQIWERDHGLPIHRLASSPKARVFAYTDELDAWLDKKLHESDRGAFVPDTGEPRPDQPSPPRRRRRLVAALSMVTMATVALLIFTNITAFRNLLGRDPLEPKSWKNSVAVLPVEDLSPDGALGYRCQSLCDNIATKLAATGVLKVSSRLSTRRFARKEVNPEAILKELGVATFLEATLQTQNEELRVNARLVRTRDGADLWSRSYSRPSGDLLKLEDEVVRDVTARLGLELTAETLERSKRRDPEDAKDYDTFLLGKSYENRFNVSDEEEDFRKAVEYLTSYIAVHSDFAMAYCSLGNVYEHRFAVRGNPEDETSMRLCYEKAYQLDPGLEETNLGMGWGQFYRKDFDRSYEYFKRAFELGPANCEVNWNIGAFFQSIGMNEKAEPYFQKALVLDPLDSHLHWLSSIGYFYGGDYEKALNSAERALSLDPGYAAYLVAAARFLVLLKRPGEALLRLEQLPDNIKDRLTIRPLWALVSAANGDREKALSLLLETQRLDQAGRVICRIDVAGTYSLLGMREEAVRTIEEGIRTGFEAVKMELYGYRFLRSYPYFEVLREMPSFKAIEKKQKEIYKARMKKYKDL
jgi:TolB-like protein/Flp pilus assembly protein TadD